MDVIYEVTILMGLCMFINNGHLGALGTLGSLSTLGIP